MFGGLRTMMFSIGVSRLNVRLRKLVFRALLDQDIGFFDKVKTGDMLRLARKTFLILIKLFSKI
jgi:ABC-type multidrug transport system fused ATPase/permease subunit